MKVFRNLLSGKAPKNKKGKKSSEGRAAPQQFSGRGRTSSESSGNSDATGKSSKSSRLKDSLQSSFSSRLRSSPSSTATSMSSKGSSLSDSLDRFLPKKAGNKVPLKDAELAPHLQRLMEASESFMAGHDQLPAALAQASKQLYRRVVLAQHQHEQLQAEAGNKTSSKKHEASVSALRSEVGTLQHAVEDFAELKWRKTSTFSDMAWQTELRAAEEKNLVGLMDIEVSPQMKREVLHAYALVIAETAHLASLQASVARGEVTRAQYEQVLEQSLQNGAQRMDKSRAWLAELAGPAR